MRIANRYTDVELVAGCQRGEPLFQRALYQQYHRLMFGVCIRYASNREDAQDILQEGFIKVFKHIKNFANKGSFEGWIRRIMVHTAIEHYRKRSKYFMVDIQEARELEFDADALGQLGTQEILALINELPTGYRTVFNLYAVEGYSHKEIGEMLNISSGTSKSQLSRAKKLLQSRLESLSQQASGS